MYRCIVDGLHMQSSISRVYRRAGLFKNMSDEIIYLDWRASGGHTNKMTKLEQINSKLSLYIKLKDAATKKVRLRIWVHVMRYKNIYLY